MAALNFASIPEFPTGNINSQKPITFLTQKRQLKASCAASSPEPVLTKTPEKPKIELEFIGPTPEGDGKYPVEKATELSGEKLLRSIMADNKIELYAAYGKVMNCGGGGSCGTCIVEVLEGKDLLNERTNTELKHLKKKAESWRLACQTIVGNKENSGSDSEVASMEEVTAKAVTMSMELIVNHLLKRSQIHISVSSKR